MKWFVGSVENVFYLDLSFILFLYVILFCIVLWLIIYTQILTLIF